MCGKFTQDDEEVTIILPDAPARPQETVTPMRFASVLCLNASGAREKRRMRWGFVPWDSPDQAKDGTRFIHARAETIDTKPTFRDAFAKRRGIIVVNSFNEGEEIAPNKTQQYLVTPTDRARLAIAVIYERWRGPGPVPLETFAMVTTPPNPLIGTITDRMPAVLDEADWPKWLGEEPVTVEQLKAILKPSDIPMDMAKTGKPPPPPRPPKPEPAQGSLF